MRFRLLGVFAHPDDDAYSLGGSLLVERDRIEPAIVLATSGGAGEISDPSLATPENLAEVREGEERASMVAFGWPDAPVHFLRYQDGGLAKVDRSELEDRLVELMAELKPHVVVTFGPEGVTMHDDHITIGRATTEAFHRARAAAGGEGSEAFRRLFHTAIPQSVIDQFWQALEDAGIDIGDRDGPFMPRGVPDGTIAVVLDCTAVMDTKLEGIKAHRTQWAEFGMMPPDMQQRFLSQEPFVQAWPPRTEAGGSPARSLFEGLGETDG
jgi:LmbE family N-acetylglucosaminyl deacetylase